MTERLVVDDLTLCAMLLVNNFGKEIELRIYTSGWFYCTLHFNRKYVKLWRCPILP